MNIEAFMGIKIDSHQAFKYKEMINSTVVRKNTNCFSVAIGSTCTIDKTLYRLGMLSEKKTVDEAYKSFKEIKDLFLSDLEAIELRYKELNLKTQSSIEQYVRSNSLSERNHIVVLFAKEFADKKIHDFHFLRYDSEIGWSEKCGRQPLFIGKNVTWPSNWYDKLIGCYKITR